MREIFDSPTSASQSLNQLFSFVEETMKNHLSEKGTNSSGQSEARAPESDVDSDPRPLSDLLLPTVILIGDTINTGSSGSHKNGARTGSDDQRNLSVKSSGAPDDEQNNPLESNADNKQALETKPLSIHNQTEQSPSFKVRTAKVASEDDKSIVFAGGPTVQGALSQPMSIHYGNDAECSLTYNSGLLETLEFKDGNGNALFRVSRDSTTRQLKLFMNSATLPLEAVPTVDKNGVMTLVSNKDTSIFVDASGRLLFSTEEFEDGKKQKRVIVVDPNKHREIFLNDRLVGKLFLDSPHLRSIHVKRDEKNPEEIEAVTYRVGKTVTHFSRTEGGMWNALVTGNGQTATVEGTLEFDESSAPVFKATDRSIKINDVVLLQERPSLFVLLDSLTKTEELLLSVSELEYEQKFLDDVKKECKKSLFELPESSIKTRLEAYQKQLNENLELLRKSLARDRVFLTKKLGDLNQQDRSESELSDKELKDIWDKMSTSRIAYERLSHWMEKHQIPEAFDTLEQWKLPIPVGGPLSAPKDQYGNFIPSIGMQNALKKDIKLDITFDTLPTPDTLRRLRSINDWCVGISHTGNKLQINRDLTKVIPAMIERGEYPSKWLSEECTSLEAKRNNLLQLVAICDEMREYGGAMLVTRKYRNKDLSYPPGCEEVTDRAGIVNLRFKWPETANMNDADTIKILDAYKKWKATDGKKFDEEQKRLAQQMKDITEQAFYGDIPLKGFARVHADGPKKGHLIEIASTYEPGMVEFNLLSGNFDVVEVDGKYNLTIKCEPRLSDYDYLDLRADPVCKPKVTEFNNLEPGAMVAVISHGKTRCVPIEEAKRLKTYQQIFYASEKIVTGAVELSMVLGGFSGAGIALYAGRAGLKAALTGVGRGLLGASGFWLNNSTVMTSDWGPGVHKIRSTLILADVANGLRHSFTPPAPAAYRSVALANLASSEWRFTKLIRGPLVKVNELPEKNSYYKTAMLTTEIAFLGILGNEFYHKYIKSKDAPIDPAIPSISGKAAVAPALKESILGRPTKQNDQVRQQLALYEQVFFRFLGHNKGTVASDSSSGKVNRLGIFEQTADAIEKRAARLSTSKEYLETISKTAGLPDEKKSVDAIRSQLDDLVAAIKPEGLDEKQTSDWMKEQREKRVAFVLRMSKTANDQTAAPAVRFSAVMALTGLSIDPAEVNDYILKQPYKIGVTRTYETYDPINLLDGFVVCSDATVRLLASEMQLRLDVPNRDALHMAGVMRGVVNDSTADEAVKIRAIENLTRLVHGLARFEQTVFPKLDSAHRVAYLTASAVRAPQDIRRFLSELAGDKTQSANVRMVSAKSLAILSFPKTDSLNAEFEILGKEYEKSPVEFAQQQLSGLKKQSSESQEPIEKLESTIALFDLAEFGGMHTPEARGKALVKVVETSTNRIAAGKDLKEEDILVAAEAISRLQKADIAALGPAEQKLLLSVLSLPEYPGIELAKIHLLRKAQFFSDAQKARLEADIVKLVAPSSPHGLGDNSLKSQHHYVRMEAVKALAEANLVSPKSIAILKSVAMPGPNSKTPALEESAAVRLESLKALMQLDNYTFKLVADACCELEKDPAIRAMAETYRLAQSFPVRDAEYRARVASASERLRGTDEANWEKLGVEYLNSVAKGYEAMTETVEIEVAVGKRVATKDTTLGGEERVYVTVYEKEKRIVPNPDRQKHLNDTIFMKALGRNPAERETAEQALFLLLSQLYENKEIKWIPDEQKYVIKSRASEVVRRLLTSEADSTTLGRTVERAKLLINDADTEPGFRLELLRSLDAYVARNGAKHPLLRQEHADYLAALLYCDANQIEFTGSNPGARHAVQIEILKQMDKYRSRSTTESLDIFTRLNNPANPAIAQARTLLYKIRDSVKERYDAAPSCQLTDGAMLSDRILKSFGTAASCQDIVDTIFESTKGSAIKRDDPRLASIRLALGAKGVDVTYTASTFTHAGTKADGQPKKVTMNGAEMIRLAAATVVLQPENTGFTDQDRLNAYKVCIELMVQGKEEGYRIDAELLLIAGDPMYFMALADVILDARKDGEHSTISTAARDILFKAKDKPARIELPDGRIVILKTSGTHLFIEETRHGRLLRAAVENTSKGGVEANYTDTIFATMKNGYSRKQSFELAKRLLSGEAKDFLKPSPLQKKEAVEMIARLSQADDDSNPAHGQDDRLAASNHLMQFLYPDGDARRLTDVQFLDKDGLARLEERLVISLSDLASEGNAAAKEMLMSIAVHNREMVLKSMLHAIPYTRRIPIETVDERARQIRYHIDCYELNPKDFTFGVEFARKSYGKNESGPFALGSVERSLKELPRDSSGNASFSKEVLHEFSAVIQSQPSQKADGISIKYSVYDSLVNKLVSPYKEINKKQMEVWTDLVCQVASKSTDELSSVENAILAAVYLESAAGLGANAPCLKSIKFDQIAERLGRTDGSDLKFNFRQPLPESLNIRLSTENGLRQAARRASLSTDVEVFKSYQKLINALKEPSRMVTLRDFHAVHGKDYASHCPDNLETGYMEMATRLFDSRPEQALRLDGGNEILLPGMYLLQAHLHSQKRFLAIKKFIEIAPPEVQLYMAKRLFGSPMPWSEELTMHAAARVLRSNDIKLQQEADDLLKKIMDGSSNQRGDLDRKEKLKNAFAGVKSDDRAPSKLFDHWKDDSEKKGVNAELQKLILEFKDFPESLQGIRKDILDENNDITRAEAIAFYVDAFKDDPKQVALMIDDILKMYRTPQMQSRLIGLVLNQISSDKARLMAALDALKKMDQHPGIQKDIESRIRSLDQRK